MTRTERIRWIVDWGCRLVVGLLFIWASIHKILEPHAFALEIFRYQAAPHAMVNIGAIYLPWLELAAGVALLFTPKLRDAAAFWLLALLIFFTVVITIDIFRGIDISCGCFSTDPKAGRIGWKKVAENSAFIVLAAWAFYESRRRPATRASSRT
jgi:cobalt-zinc-cadmium efflux system protein